MITKDGTNVSILDLTPENYLVPKGEEGRYHVRQEVVQFNPKTGVRVSKPRIQKYGRKQFEQTIRDMLRKQGYTVDILYNPTEWLKAQKERRAARKSVSEADIQQRIQEGIAEGVAKVLAEVEKKSAKKPQKPAKSASSSKGKGNIPAEEESAENQAKPSKEV